METVELNYCFNSSFDWNKNESSAQFIALEHSSLVQTSAY